MADSIKSAPLNLGYGQEIEGETWLNIALANVDFSVLSNKHGPALSKVCASPKDNDGY